MGHCECNQRLGKTQALLISYNLKEMPERVSVAPERVLGRDQEPKQNWINEESLKISDSHPIPSPAPVSRGSGGQMPFGELTLGVLGLPCKTLARFKIM